MIDFTETNLVGLADRLMSEGRDHGWAVIAFGGSNHAVKVPTRQLILNLIFWEPNIMLGLIPEQEDWESFESITVDSIKSIQTRLYKKAISRCPDVPHMRIVLLYTYNIDRISNFTQMNIPNYMPTIDALGLSRLFQHTEIKKILDKKFDDKFGTQVAETQLKMANKQFQMLLRQDDSPDNCLLPYMRAGTLKSNQIPQFAIAYGARADINDVMMKHVIGRSSFHGLETPADFAIESLSGKKSTYYSRTGIRDSQYFARKLRLVCSTIRKIYPGSCGSPGWIPYTIPSRLADQYVNRVVVTDDDKRVVLTERNIKDFVDKPVRLASPFACRHTDGFCEHCAGYGDDQLIKYMPLDSHIGLIAAAKLAEILSQRILSTKHLLTTVTILYILLEKAAKYFIKVDDYLYWKQELQKVMSDLCIRFPENALSAPLSDLNLNSLPVAESYSRIPYMEILKDGEIIDTIDLVSEAIVPYLSEQTLAWMHDIYRSITVDEDDMISVPLAKFNVNNPFMKFTVMNDDQVSYLQRVEHFLENQIAGYTSVPACVSQFCSIVYQKKTGVNSFFLEIILRAHLISDENAYGIPIVEDPEHVHFGNLADVISYSTVTAKLAYEYVKRYITTTDTPLVYRNAGLFAPYFGILS